MNVPAENLIFIDEAGANLQMAPIYGRAYGGERATISAPYKRGNQITMIGAISLEKIETAMYGEWAATGEIFNTFIKDFLCPILKPEHVVVMDNVGFHKSTKVIELINLTGAQVIYLPPYHPELNPIEEMWSKIKNFMRKESARTINKFNRTIKDAFSAVVKSDLMGWFTHAGY